jgi:uncharacterized protein YqfB (UPF0267 family)
MRNIELKIVNPHFQAILKGKKKCEVRHEDDYHYQVGDTLTLCQWIPKQRKFTGKYVRVRITHILRDTKYLKPNHAVLSFEVIKIGDAFKTRKKNYKGIE